MESVKGIRDILPDKSAYKRTLYLIKNYKDLKRGEELNEENRRIPKKIDRAIELMEDDEYIEIIKMTMEGVRAEEISEKENIDIRNVYKQRRRLVKRLSVLLYGDEAL